MKILLIQFPDAEEAARFALEQGLIQKGRVIRLLDESEVEIKVRCPEGAEDDR